MSESVVEEIQKATAKFKLIFIINNAQMRSKNVKKAHVKKKIRKIQNNIKAKFENFKL